VTQETPFSTAADSWRHCV